MQDTVTQCPECGAQLIVNFRGQRRFTCGRVDRVEPDRGCLIVTDVYESCRTSEIAAGFGVEPDPQAPEVIADAFRSLTPDSRTIAEMQLIIGESPDMLAKLLAEIDMDADGLSTVRSSLSRRADEERRGIRLHEREADELSGYIRGILEPMAARFAAYVQVVRLLDEGIR